MYNFVKFHCPNKYELLVRWNHILIKCTESTNPYLFMAFANNSHSTMSNIFELLEAMKANIIFRQHSPINIGY